MPPFGMLAGPDGSAAQVKVPSVHPQFGPRSPVPKPQPRANADMTGTSEVCTEGSKGLADPEASVRRTMPGPRVSVERQLP